MILFTGSGALYQAFHKLYDCDVLSIRNCEDDQLRTAVCNANIIVHNAALIKGSSLIEYINANFILTKRLIDIAYEVNPKAKLIYMGSMSYLKDAASYHSVSEMTDYAYSKYLGETYCLRHPMRNVRALRCSTIFYKDAERDGLSKLAHDAAKTRVVKVYQGGIAQRDFISLSTVCRYVYKIANSDILSPVLNIVSGKSRSFMSFASMLMDRNPSLKLHNIDAMTAPTLHDFSSEELEPLGLEKDTVEEDFLNYFKACES